MTTTSGLSVDIVALKRARRRAGVSVARARARRLSCLALALLATATARAAPPAGASLPLTLEVRMFSAGHADATLLSTSAGHHVLIDAGRGTSRAGDHLVSRRLLPYFRARGIKHLDAFVITHPHWDHVGDPRALARGVQIKRIVVNPDGARWLGRQLRRLAPLVTAVRGQRLRFGPLSFDVLHPPRAGTPWRGNGLTAENNRSLVLRAAFGRHRLLFPGDLMAAGERWMLSRRRARPGRVDVLKLGHHGSLSSTSQALLEQLAPVFAVASSGARNRWGMPHRLVRQRLRRRGIPLFGTDRQGAVRVVLGTRTIAVSPVLPVGPR